MAKPSRLRKRREALHRIRRSTKLPEALRAERFGRVRKDDEGQTSLDGVVRGSVPGAPFRASLVVRVDLGRRTIGLEERCPETLTRIDGERSFEEATPGVQLMTLRERLEKRE